jgi:hypothetical protein
MIADVLIPIKQQIMKMLMEKSEPLGDLLEKRKLNLKQFIGKGQLAALREACCGEEGKYFRAMVSELKNKIAAMPKTYETDGQGDDAVAVRRCIALAPSWALVKVEDEALFRKLFHEQALSKLDPKAVYDELGQDAVLLCWEAPGKFCHRRVVAEWFEAALGIMVNER